MENIEPFKKVGRSISRKEAIFRSQNILYQADSDRDKIAQIEASRGISPNCLIDEHIPITT